MLSEGFEAAATPSEARRRSVHERLRGLAEASSGGLDRALRAVAAEDCLWRAAHPLNAHAGNAAAAAAVWAPLMDAMPDLERRDAIMVAGVYQGRTQFAAMGHYAGTFRRDWCGIPATGRAVFLRYGEVWELGPDDRAVRVTLLWDILDLMRQAEVWPLGPSLGVEALWPGPITGDGVRHAPSPADDGRASIEQTLGMHRTLAEFDDEGALGRAALLAMPQRAYWHPKMMWYGPAGIGTTRGLDGFVDGHQLPFRRAFARPQGSFAAVTAERARHGAGHFIRIGDGPCSVTGGWPSVYAVHTGADFCGLPPTGRPVTMRVMDFYLHHEGLIRENWVPLDMLHLLAQMGVEPLRRLHAQRAARDRRAIG